MPDGSWQPLAGQLAKALPGQRINLRVTAPLLPSKLKITDYEWLLPETNFKDYTASETAGTLTHMEPADLLKQDVGFYLAGGGEKTVELKFKLDGLAKDLTTTLDIEMPSAEYTRTTGAVRFSQPSDLLQDFYAGFFANEGQQGGFNSIGKVDVPAGWPEGKWHWVQVGTSNRTLTELDGTYKTYSKNDIYGLDTNYPYAPRPSGSHPTGSEQTTSDIPRILLSGYNARTADDDFSVYIMFLPDGQASRYVPLKKLDWGWNAEASKDQEGWHMTSSGFYSQDPVDTTGHPEWSVNIAGGEYNQLDP